MVKIAQPNECDCKTCPGHVPVPKGYYGGMLCLHSCHDDQRAKDKAERDRLELCPICHTNRDYQTRCCAKLAKVREILYSVQNAITVYGEGTLDIKALLKEIDEH